MLNKLEKCPHYLTCMYHKVSEHLKTRTQKQLRNGSSLKWLKIM